MRKTLIAILLILVLAAGLAACGGSPAQGDDPPDPLASSNHELLRQFNDATAQAVKLKPGYTKTRYTKITNLDFGALSNLSMVREGVYGFFGVESNGEGTMTYTVKKGESSDLMRASTLTMEDIEGISAAFDGAGGTVVTVRVKDGGTRWGGAGGNDPGSGTAKSAIDNGPLFWGVDGSPDYDHKTAQNFYYTINHTDGAGTKDIGETVTNAVFTARIDGDGRLTELACRLDMRVDVYHVKYSFFTLSDNSGEGTGEVTYSGFAY